MKALILNTMVANGGDAAILISTLRMLRSEYGDDVDVSVCCEHSQAVAKLYPEIRFRKRLNEVWAHARAIRGLGRLLARVLKLRFELASSVYLRFSRTIGGLFLTKAERELIDEYASANLLVVSGGTYLVERYGLDTMMADFRLMLRSGTPLVLFTQTIGPITSPGYRRTLRRVFSRAKLILARDQATVEVVGNICPYCQNVHICSDTVFALADVQRIREKAACPLSAGLRVAISVRDWPFFTSVESRRGMQRYRQAIADVCDWLVQRFNAEITFVSTCQGIEEYWADDSKTAEQIIQRLAPKTCEQVFLDNRFHRPSDLLEALRSFDLAISTRMHVGILSLCAGCAVVPITYETKTDSLFAQLEMQNLPVDIETITSSGLMEKVQHAIANLSTIRANLPMLVSQHRDSALEAARFLREALNKEKASENRVNRPAILAGRSVLTIGWPQRNRT